MPTTVNRDRLSMIKKKEELKDSLGKKFQKKFGPKYAKIIFPEVEKFLSQGRLTEESFNNLEQTISDRIASLSNKSKTKTVDTQKTESATQLTQAQPKSETVVTKRSQESKKSSNVVNSDIYNEFKEINKPYYPIYQRPKEDEWTQIQKYKAEQWEKEVKLEKEDGNKKKMMLKALYESQLKEKEENDAFLKSEHDRWVEQENQLHNDWLRDEERKRKEENDNFLREKETRLHQINEVKERRRREVESEKQLAARMVQQMKAQNDEETEMERQREYDEKMRMRKFLEENDTFKSRKKDQMKLEKEEDKRMIKESMELDEKKERQREEEVRRRLNRVNLRAELILGSDLVQEGIRKRKAEEERQQREAEEIEKYEIENDKQRKEDQKKRAMLGQKLLYDQIEERQRMKKNERETELKYSEDFLKQNNLDLKKEQEDHIKAKITAQKNAQLLVDQMNGPKETVDNMTISERELNRKLLGKAANGEIEVSKGWKL